MARVYKFAQKEYGISSDAITLQSKTLTWNGNPVVGGGVSTLGPVGSTPNANAATLTGSTLNLQPCSSTQPGVLTTLDGQHIAGNKILDGPLSLANATYNPNPGSNQLLSIANTSVGVETGLLLPPTTPTRVVLTQNGAAGTSLLHSYPMGSCGFNAKFDNFTCNTNVVPISLGVTVATFAPSNNQGIFAGPIASHGNGIVVSQPGIYQITVDMTFDATQTTPSYFNWWMIAYLFFQDGTSDGQLNSGISLYPDQNSYIQTRILSPFKWIINTINPANPPVGIAFQLTALPTTPDTPTPSGITGSARLRGSYSSILDYSALGSWTH